MHDTRKKAIKFLVSCDVVFNIRIFINENESLKCLATNVVDRGKLRSQGSKLRCQGKHINTLTLTLLK